MLSRKVFLGLCGRVFVIAFMVIFSGAVFATGTYDGGDGTEGNPFQIATAGQLIELSQHSEDWNKCFILTADIDMDQVLLGEGVEMAPIGTSSIPFSGAFDGGGHVISNLTIDLPESDDVGLFGVVSGYDTEIKNLVLANVSVSGKNNVGGLVGNNAGKKTSRCSSSGVVNGSGNTGGLVGLFDGAMISQCFSSGVVNGDQRTGGLFGQSGYFRVIRIDDCYSTADVNATGHGAGGFIGRAEHSEINRCYSTGVVICEAEERVSDGFAHSPSGHMDEANGCFWNIDTSGKTNVYRENFGKIIGLDTASMKSSRFYSYCGWSGDVWTIDEGNDYPRLAWENKVGAPMPESEGFKGAGTADDPYKIESAAELRILSFDLSVWDKHFVLTADIDLAGLFMTPIGVVGGGNDIILPFGDPVFSGSFDGGGHVISNLSIDLPEYDYVGLFSYLNEAEVKNLGLRNANIKGNRYVGALVGYNWYGNISQCFAEGVVDSEDYVGGFVGWNDGAISDCYSICSVAGTGMYGAVGGFVGLLRNGTVSRCYSVGIVGDDLKRGGFVGLRSFNPYPLSDCYWNITVNPGLLDSGFGDLDEVEGLSTEDMMVAGSYASWDFVGGDSDGKMDIWYLPEGDYPRLFWEADAGDCDYDGLVDGGDLVVLGQWWLTSADDLGADERLLCDFDFDGIVGLGDFALLAGNWLVSTGP